MYKTIIVIDNHFELPTLDSNVINFDQYLADYPKINEPKIQIINLCNSSKYLSQGYYCSLLAEARQHRALPSVNIINDIQEIGTRSESNGGGLSLPAKLCASITNSSEQELWVFLGWIEQAEYRSIAKYIFGMFPAPILKIHLKKEGDVLIAFPELTGISELSQSQQVLFLQRLSHFTQTIWRSRKPKKSLRWDMAILTNPEEKTPPSDKKAIESFVKAAVEVGINAQVITPKQANTINQYDALFIRETTAINHHTYRLARKHEQEGLVVMDDATSILRCCNKVFLHDAFNYNKVPSPKSSFESNCEPHNCKKLAEEFGFPMVLKLPESSFSMGVFKVDDLFELQLKLADMLKQSALVLVQEFIFTEYDWRIGVLNGRAIYACRYFMARNHWQIYNHSSKKHFSGDFETLPTFEVPKEVLDAAVKASNIVGKGFYGVDIKQSKGKVYVIEVNDNPSVEYKVEDLYLGKELYKIIMQEFANRLEVRGR